MSRHTRNNSGTQSPPPGTNNDNNTDPLTVSTLSSSSSSNSSSNTMNVSNSSELQQLLQILIQQGQSTQTSNLALLEQQRRTATAGQIPKFSGQMNDIEVHQWLLAIERWFNSVGIMDNNDKERITAATNSLQGAAINWWQAEVVAGRGNITWNEFRTNIKKQFLPIKVEEWAFDKIKELSKNVHKDMGI